jgi:hypothetical protein
VEDYALILGIYISGWALQCKRVVGLAVSKCRDQRQADHSGVELPAFVGADGLVDRKVIVVRVERCMDSAVAVLQQRTLECRGIALGQRGSLSDGGVENTGNSWRGSPDTCGVGPIGGVR